MRRLQAKVLGTKVLGTKKRSQKAKMYLVYTWSSFLDKNLFLLYVFFVLYINLKVSSYLTGENEGQTGADNRSASASAWSLLTVRSARMYGPWFLISILDKFQYFAQGKLFGLASSRGPKIHFITDCFCFGLSFFLPTAPPYILACHSLVACILQSCLVSQGQ